MAGPRFPKRYADVAQRLRVPCGFLVAACFIWLSQPSVASLAVGLPVAAAGLMLRAWAAGHLEKNLRLVDSGPYAHLRNPLYAGTLLAAAGLAMAARRPLIGLLFAVFFTLAYLPAIQQEEQHLKNLFPAYAAYAGRVPLLWPRWRGVGSPRRFRWGLYRRNREYQALAGFAAGVAVLLLKL